MTPEEKNRLLVLLTLMSQGSSGRSALSAIQPILAIIEKQKADEQARKDASRAQTNSIMGQVGGTVGSLGGMYLVGRALAPAATGAAEATGAGALGAGTAGAGATGAGASVATPNLLSAQMVGTAPAAETSTLGTVGSAALPVAVAAALIDNAWEGGLKDIVRGRGDRADWTNQAMNMNPYTAPINIGLRLFGKRSLGKMMTTGKSDAQLMRDDFRGVLKEKGIVDDGYNVTLANGAKFNLGLDGKTKYTNSDGKTSRNAWDVDLNDPLAQYAVSRIDPHIRNMYGAGDPKKGLNPEQYTGMVVNAVTNGAKTKEEVDANVASVLGTKPFEGSAPLRPTAPPPAQALQTPTPQPAPTPIVKPTFMAPPVNNHPAPQPAPAPAPAPQPPLSGPSVPPVPKSPMQTANPQQGLLGLQQQLGIKPQNGGNIMDLIRALGQRQKGTKS